MNHEDKEQDGRPAMGPEWGANSVFSKPFFFSSFLAGGCSKQYEQGEAQ